jgi:DNA-binding NarL/FixJ family response regulator
MHDVIDVVLVEDHPTFRFGLRTRLEMESDIRVVGETGSGDDALDLIDRTAPDVVIVDLNLPGIGGIDLIRRLAIAAPSARTLVLTMLADDWIVAAMRAGADGFLLKDCEPSRIVSAIRAVAAGDSVFSGAVVQNIVGMFDRHSQGDPVLFPELTARERGVLSLVAAGLTNQAIGQRLGLRPKTVRNYVSNVIGKIHAADRAEAILRAQQAGISKDHRDHRRPQERLPHRPD